MERLNHMGDLHYIAKATGYPYSTTEAQPERAIEIVGAIKAIMEGRDAATARAEKAEALLREARYEALTIAAKVCRDRAETSCMTGGACERNDAAAIERLRDGDDDDDDAPTPDDRRGEDGEAIDAQGCVA